jgi:hypothetical protein
MHPDSRKLLSDMQDAARAIAEFVAGKTPEMYVRDRQFGWRLNGDSRLLVKLFRNFERSIRLSLKALRIGRQSSVFATCLFTVMGKSMT